MEKLMLRSVVSRISLTRPQLAAQVETLLVNMGQQGQIRGQVSDEALKGLLEQVCRLALPILFVGLISLQVSNPAPAKSTSSVSQSSRTKTLGGGITVSLPSLPKVATVH